MSFDRMRSCVICGGGSVGIKPCPERRERHSLSPATKPKTTSSLNMFAKVIFFAVLAIACVAAKPLFPVAAYSAYSAPVVAASPALAAYSAPVAAAYTAAPFGAAYTAALPYAAGFPYAATAALPYTSLVL
ncbi:uncharacterized protein LOC109399718 [Aedes albopictus]|uniref:Cuticle protein n=1 Tax=Aedes albopictus TaxID=7160 RepID=A0ABM1YBN9_AEDAL